MTFETVIGLETHVQLATQSKMFSGASTSFGADPNRQACPVDLALPGVLPVINREAVACAIRFGLAVGARLAERSVFARKNYFYPDLPKGYQISQFELPVVVGGSVTFQLGSGKKSALQTVQLTRAHLEEDAGKSLHENYPDASGIDLNRAGTPLLEIVTEPDMSSARQAVAYARTLHALVVWLGICDGNMQEGSFRCDANVSIRRPGEPLGTRTEIKNLNSFRFLEQAIDFEIQRQTEVIEDGGEVVQETRLYDPDRDETRSMRSKEDAMDYRYFPDPDLPDLVIAQAWVDEIREAMPELPDAKRRRFEAQYNLGVTDAAQICASRDIADYFEALVAALPTPDQLGKTAANWVMADLSAAINRDEIDFKAAPVRPAALAALVTRIHDGTITGRVAKDLFAQMWAEPVSDRYEDALAALDAIIETKGLKQINDDGALLEMVQQVLAANEKSVNEFLSGKDKALNALVGQVMKATKGKGNPQRINQLLRESVERSKC